MIWQIFSLNNIKCIHFIPRYHVYFRTTYIRVDVSTIPTDWYHLIFNFFGASDAEGVAIHHNGVKIGSNRLAQYTNAAGQGVVVLGRYNVRADRDFGSVMVDEMLFFNRHLTSQEIQILYNMHK